MPKAVDPQAHNSDSLGASCGDTQGEPTDEGTWTSIVHQRTRVIRIWRGIAVESYRRGKGGQTNQDAVVHRPR